MTVTCNLELTAEERDALHFLLSHETPGDAIQTPAAMDAALRSLFRKLQELRDGHEC